MDTSATSAGRGHDDEGMPQAHARAAQDDELELVAALRWRWVSERDGLPVTQRNPFVQNFATWARTHSATHRCLVLLHDNKVAGMAFLVVTARVPTPRALTRASGDVQCVYVVPEARDNGGGSLLIGAVLDLAAELDLERVTVHSSTRAISLYQRQGFTASPVLLQAQPPDPGR